MRAEGERVPMIASEHPEAFCERCGRSNIVWFAPSEAWNEVTVAVDPGKERGVIWCPYCFAELAERHGWHVTGFRAEVERRPAPQPPLATDGFGDAVVRAEGERESPNFIKLLKEHRRAVTAEARAEKAECALGEAIAAHSLHVQEDGKVHYCPICDRAGSATAAVIRRVAEDESHGPAPLARDPEWPGLPQEC